MRQYEVTFIVDPVLSADEIKSTATTYVDHLKSEGCTIVNVDEMGLLQLAYPINKRSSGIYFCVEFQSETGALIPKLELAFRRDERIMRFLTVTLNKYGVKYNDDKRNGLIGSKKKKKDDKAEDKKSTPAKSTPAKSTPAKSTPAKAETAKAETAKVETAKVETAKAEPAKAESAKAESAKESPEKAVPAKAVTAVAAATAVAESAAPEAVKKEEEE